MGPNAVQRPKPVKARRIAKIVTAMETAGSGADDKVCINFTKFVNTLCIVLYNNEIIFDLVNSSWDKKLL